MNCLLMQKIIFERSKMSLLFKYSSLLEVKYPVTWVGQNLGRFVWNISWHTHWGQLRKNQYYWYNVFFTICIDMILNYKLDIHIKPEVPRLFLSESVVYFLPLFISFFEKNNKECVLIKEKQFSNWSFQEVELNV